MSLPFWRAAPSQPTVSGPPNVLLDDGTFGPPNIVQSASQSAQSWDVPLINGRALPGMVRLTKAPPLALQEVFSKAENRDAQVRKTLGLKSPEFCFQCTLVTEEHWRAWLAMHELLLPVEKANGRAEVRSIAHPLVNAQRISYAYVFLVDPVNPPQAGGPCVFDVHFRAWWPSDTTKRNGNAAKNLKDPTNTQNRPPNSPDTVPFASSAPSVPTPSFLLR